MLVLACSHSFAEPAFQPPNEVRLATNGLHSSNLYLSLATLLKCFCYFIKNEKSPATSGIKEFWLISFLLLLIWSSDPGLTWFGPPTHTYTVKVCLDFCVSYLSPWEFEVKAGRSYLFLPAWDHTAQRDFEWKSGWDTRQGGMSGWMGEGFLHVRLSVKGPHLLQGPFPWQPVYSHWQVRFSWWELLFF